MAKAKLLLIDDDRGLLRALELYLSRSGYGVVLATSGAEGLRRLFETRPDLVVLDIMMPELDGREVCLRIREVSEVPIIMLTAMGQEADRVKGFQVGADDYVAKPFSLKELEARVEAVLRRANRYTVKEKTGFLYTLDNLIIDSERWQVLKNGERVDLTPTELKLLLCLAENAGRVLSNRQLLEAVWGPEYVDNTDYPKLFIWRLRQKLEPDPLRPKYILTERGIGYRMVTAN
ncbi:MAG: response regulator [Anaerolineae bacterium]